MVEIGCGRGQLTIPLAEKVPRLQIIGVDLFKGVYSRSRVELLSALRSHERRIGIKVVVGDYHAWLESQPESKYDAIISSEFLPEIDDRRMRDLFVDSYRVLKASGKTVHSFLSPRPRNARQRRLIEADSDPRWTKTPPIEWFSPAPNLVREYLKHAGFDRIRFVRLTSRLVIKSNASKQMLKDWGIRQTYWTRNRVALENEGLELPDWLIIKGTKIV